MPLEGDMVSTARGDTKIEMVYWDQSYMLWGLFHVILFGKEAYIRKNEDGSWYEKPPVYYE